MLRTAKNIETKRQKMETKRYEKYHRCDSVCHKFITLITCRCSDDGTNITM